MIKHDFSHSEENYIKTIFHLSEQEQNVSTNAIADVLKTKPASVSDMLKKLSQKEVLNYVKYKGVSLTEEGRKVALWIIRKHRLWEVFLVEKLHFSWDEVHDVAEQLEHIKSTRMIERLDEFLGFPKFDPHGDPIPDADGNFQEQQTILLCEATLKKGYKVVAVKDTEKALLQYLDKIGVGIGSKVEVLDKIEYDGSLELDIDARSRKIVSKQVAENILILEN
ncbi:metal-dependent transcriptional regulator [Sediminitomix flava]|uniref:Transcriptional regulator MntR n=1 Tax=Sediminitomix flava TaxID=379075 RepID=A0A315ZGW6_SEDFL|nr:metal-dependent transcriptional regulator [Sediminitomix flava]PWJ44409.1 DtxR family iron (metal) dependent repressor [Sediminitomix flava]